jgi:hypothetical protein
MEKNNKRICAQLNSLCETSLGYMHCIQERLQINYKIVI